ncbi:MAG: hypothetical protein K9N62_18885 [Verrucomicrobia bacterium]|jgi:hypothetical protein|nr:hypothetical protein [Verrucomicrobiota bacterium]
MHVSELQHEIELLPQDQQDRLAAFLFALRMRREGTISEIQERLDDKNPEKWISWDKAKSALGIDRSESDE